MELFRYGINIMEDKASQKQFSYTNFKTNGRKIWQEADFCNSIVDSYNTAIKALDTNSISTQSNLMLFCIDKKLSTFTDKKNADSLTKTDTNKDLAEIHKVATSAHHIKLNTFNFGDSFTSLYTLSKIGEQQLKYAKVAITVESAKPRP